MISLIVPVYNTADFLRQCLDSILGQTLRDIEVVCVDDGSTDSSADILEEYASSDSRIRVIHKENGGLVSARKAGIKEAAGEYIGYVDSDDWIEADMIERLYHVLLKENVDVVMCGRFEDTGNVSRPVYHGIPAGRYGKQDLINIVYPNMIVNGAFFEWGIFPSVWDKLFRRKSIEKYQIDVDNSLVMGEDAACVYPALLNADSIYVLHDCFYHYRQSAESMVKHNDNGEKQRERFRILYHSVKVSFEKYKGIYDMQKQWKEYLLFLMIPRAETLYENIEQLEYLFPFPNVKRASRIILYGMGTYGQFLYRFIKHTGICTILACVDKNCVELEKQGFPVIHPDKIENYEYDAIVVASSFAGARNSIYRELSVKCPADKIHLMDEKVIHSAATLRAFGLID